MRITEALLKKIIREELQEVQSPTERAAALGMAVLLIGNPSSRATALVYDPKILQQRIERISSGSGSERSKQSLIDSAVGATYWVDRDPVVRSGVRFFRPTRKDAVGRCYDSSVIEASVAWGDTGLGPAAYDAAMWYADGLSSDRRSVSPGARRVWSVYMSRAEGGELEALPYDDLKNPQTPQPEDDCAMLDGGPESPLNKLYRHRSKPPGLEDMERNHQDCLIQLTDLGYPVDRLADNMGMLFNSLWHAGRPQT